MSHKDIPRGFISLPEVSEHTDKIFLDSLGLPVGFDEERLGVGVRSLDAVRMLIGVHTLRITCQEGSESPLTISGKVNSDSSLVGSAVATRILQAPSTARKPGRTAAVVELNSKAMEETYPALKRDVRSPRVRAKVLNKAVKPGLNQAAYNSLGLDSRFGAGYTAGLLGVGNLIAVGDGYTPTKIALGLGFGPFIWALYARELGKPSLLPFWPIDRYAIARGKIATTRFFAEKK